MGKLLKILLYLAGFVVLGVVLLVVVVSLTVDPNDYKDEIATQVKEYTGRQLTIAGDIKLSVFPWLGLELGETTLGNAPGFPAVPFARVGGAGLRLKLMPLLRKELELDTVSLQDLELNLAINKAGVSNWDDLAGPGDDIEVEDAPGSTPALAAFTLGGVDIQNARIVWDDQSTGARYAVEQLALTTGPLTAGDPVDVELSFDVASREPEVTAHLELSARVSADVSAQQFGFQGLALNVEAEGPALPAGKAGAELQANAQADLKAQTLQLSGVRLTSGPLQVEAEISGTSLTEAPVFTGTVHVPEFNLRALLAELGQTLPETADAAALTRVAMKTSLKATDTSLALDDLAIILDDTGITGTLKIADFTTSATRFNLRVDSMDVDRYLPPPGEEKPAVATPAEGAAAATQLLPVETLSALNVEGTLRIDKLKVSGLKAGDISVVIKGRDGLLTSKQSVGKLYSGSYQGETRVDVRGKSPAISLQENLSGVQVGPLLGDLTGEERLTGTGQFSAALKARGNTTDQLTRTLNGTGDFAFKEGAVKGINIAQLIREAKARLKGGKPAAGNAENKTDFSELTGTLKITNGLIRNEDLSAKSPLLRVTGKGTVNLVSEKIDYRVTPKIVGSTEGQGGAELNSLKGVAIPIHLTGSMVDPSFRVDLQAALSESTKEQVKEKVKEETKQLEDKLKDKLRKFF